MPDFLKMLGDTADSLGGAVAAPAGLAWDLASSPFDNKDDDLGSLMNKAASRAGDILDPLGNQNTFTGWAFGHTMQGLDHIYREEISEPTAAAFTQLGHFARTGDLNSSFDEKAWADAYRVAQHRSIGQSAMLMSANWSYVGRDKPSDVLDPMDPAAWDTLKKRNEFAASVTSGAIDFAARWYADPGVLLGHAGAAARAARLGKLGESQKLRLFDEMTAQSASRTAGLQRALTLPGRGERAAIGVQSRTDRYLAMIGGKNTLGRPLNAAEVYAATPELRRSYSGKTIAGLLADAGKLEDPTLVADAQRRILAVSGGDMTQAARLRSEMSDAGDIADALDNLRNGGTLNLDALALSPSLRYNPGFVADLERQLQNLNSKGDVDKVADNFLQRFNGIEQANQSLYQARASLDFLPGAHRAGQRALKRENGTRLIDKVAGVQDATIKRFEDIADREGVSTVYQKSTNQVPVVLVKTVGLFASPYTKAPKAIADALRQTHYVGVANLHEWSAATEQLNSMMKVAGVDDMTRLKELSGSFTARTEAEKQRIINRIEDVSMKSLARTASEKLGREVDTDYVSALMADGAMKRQKHLSSLRGRAYAATEDGSDSALRIDQINDDGTPLALPLLSTQLANSVPLLDVHLAKTMVHRAATTQRLADMGDAWRSEARGLNGLKAKLARANAGQVERLQKQVEAHYDRMDWLVEAGQLATRVWKYGVLFRLGYPIRVLMDDHMRIWSQVNAGSFYLGNSLEAGKNAWWNRAPAFLAGDGRRAQAVTAFRTAQAERERLLLEYGHKDIHSADDLDAIIKAAKGVSRGKATATERAEHQAVLDRLDPEGAVSTYYRREATIIGYRRQITGKRNAIARWKQELEEAQTKRSLGVMVDTTELRAKIDEAEKFVADKEGAIAHLADQQPAYAPDETWKQVKTLNDMLDEGMKGFLSDKRKIGTGDVKLSGNMKGHGAFAGPYGKVALESSSSRETFTHQMEGVEQRTALTMGQGSHRVLAPSEPGHLDAWADAINYQMRLDPAARFFLKGGTVDEFPAWLNEPEQAFLRERVAHFAHDPVDWAHRIDSLIKDYLPTDELRDIVTKRDVSARELGKMFADVNTRPAVHGQAAAFNIGGSPAAKAVSRTVNRAFSALSDMPTDTLSRHPFFSTLYKAELRKLHATAKRAAGSEGRAYTQADIEGLEGVARQKALGHLRQTLFDMSAHSHAAHVLRFLSPFFAAHQESLSRWWRIAQDNPAVIRRFQQGFDMPRKLGLVYDAETGEPVKDGEGISTSHRIIIKVPEAWGGKSTAVDKWLRKQGGGKYWSVNENGFNLVLQGGLMNPGAGPLLTVPVEALVAKYAEYPELERAARILNPYPPDSPLDAATPAWAQRLYAVIRKDKSEEWSTRYAANLNEAYIGFRDANGREPTDEEMDAIAERAGRQTNGDMVLMLMQNMTSPVPAKPESKYSAIQHGWYQIRSKAQAEGRDFEWMLDQFRERYGDAYLAMVYSSSLNPARLTGTHGEVAAVKTFNPLLKNIDPALARMVVGPASALAAQDDKSLGEYSPDARAWLSKKSTGVGTNETFIGTKEPREALLGTMVRDGWEQYSAFTGALTALAQQRGLDSYAQDSQLVEAKRKMVEYLKGQNFAWADDYNSFDNGAYDRLLRDMHQVVDYAGLKNDTERQDVAVLRQYLTFRDGIAAVLQQRADAGGASTMEAQANSDLAQAFFLGVQKLAESNTYFETYMYNGIIDRDPWIRAGESVVTGGQ